MFTVILVQKIFKGSFEKGTASILNAIENRSSLIPGIQAVSQLITSALTVGFGGSAGLESPIVSAGAAIGSRYSQSFRFNFKDRTMLLACGVAAGIAAAFNAPIAGVIFALEVLLLDLSITAFTPVIISAAVGALCSNVILKEGIILSFHLQQPFNYNNVPYYILLGVSLGYISVYYSRTFLKVEALFLRFTGNLYTKVLIGGLILAFLVILFPSLYGEGYSSIKILSLQKPEKLFDESILSKFGSNEWIILFFIGAVLLIKVVATGVTLGSGGNGGNFAPSLFVGAYFGFFFSKSVNLILKGDLPVSNFTIVGMAGVLSGIYHAPLTAIFLIAEITGGYTLMIPLMIVSAISFTVSKYIEPYPMDIKMITLSGRLSRNDKDKSILKNLEIQKLIETDFHKVLSHESLGELVKLISKSKRNIFPVVDEFDQLSGIIKLDNIRELIFDSDLYNKTKIKELLEKPEAVILINESMESAMKKFDETEAWNLPVVDNNKYVGFISKSRALSSYRNRLILGSGSEF
ncbi:chloride channel protein [Leptospira sp. 201903071]|uniref:chloride channel protein n=1 Tax=Leptospira ainazelensis TaxID=2810034 RepID=UPI00196250C9|nr:chloride channel protein [Leptospira ainazelensis]MBM9501506.1 chloride channel protein [Leptospira ainazelensis]